jgi:hypothetical protein
VAAPDEWPRSRIPLLACTSWLLSIAAGIRGAALTAATQGSK